MSFKSISISKQQAVCDDTYLLKMRDGQRGKDGPGQDHPKSKGKSSPLWKTNIHKQDFRTVTLQFSMVPYCLSNSIISYQQLSSSFHPPLNCTIHICNLGFCPLGAVVSWEGDGYTAKWLSLLWSHTVNCPTMSNAHWHSWVKLDKACGWHYMDSCSPLQDRPCLLVPLCY